MAPNKTLPFDATAFGAKYGGMTITKYRATATVYAQGEPSNSLFYIQQGRVKLSFVSEGGKEAVIAILEAGDLCGEGCLSGQPLHISTATTLTECVIARLEKTSVVAALLDGPAFFSDFVIESVLTKNCRFEAQLIGHLFDSSEERLARALLCLANYGKEARDEVIIPKINQETLAKMIGTTRGRVNYFMNKFRKLGFIEYNGDIRVHSSLLNVVLHDQPNGE
jgi:CRP/FNR family cyclic AMP-dependent transcriptional regulator